MTEKPDIQAIESETYNTKINIDKKNMARWQELDNAD